MISAVGGGGFGEQTLKSLLLAKNSNFELFATDTNPNCPQFQFVRDFSVVSPAGAKEFISEIHQLCDRFKINAIFPGHESELVQYSKNRESFERKGIFLGINSKSVIDICMDKSETSKHLSQAGVSMPKFVRATKEDEINSVDFYPVVIKPNSHGGGSANVFIARDESELFALSKYLKLGHNKIEFVIQEYVGTPENEFTVGVLHDNAGQLINAIVLRRHLNGQLNIRQSVPNNTRKKELGEKLVVSSGVSQGDFGNYPEVKKKCIEIAELIGSTSALNIQCRLVDNQLKVFEINPRLSGTTSLRAMVGYNEPELLLKHHVLRDNIERGASYKSATIIRSLVENFV